MAMQRYFLGLGSNLGDREHNLAQAVARLARTPGVSVRRCSSIYETAPVGPEQPDYLNAAVEIETSLAPVDLLHACKEIEAALGRVEGPRWGPRAVDIDVLLGEQIVGEPSLQVPHLALHKRAFALLPLSELAPDAVHPILGRTVQSLLEDVAGQKAHRKGALYVDV
jgi:2-amino-4-hydroxy-6-hydroxymethyldihydropteridine diphosphokinase